MNYENKTEEQLIDELAKICQKLSELEESEVERKQIGESLTQSEQRFRTLVETIPHGIQENDTNGIITFSNPAHSRIHGYKEGELVGKPIWEILASEEDREELRQYIDILVREQPPPTPYIAQDRTKDGSVIDVQVDWDYKRDKEGKVTGFISVITDITERKKAEKEILKSQKLESLGILAGGIAHDFNNLLTAILGNISMAESFADSGSKDNMHKALKEAENASLRAKGLSQQLLTFASGGLPVKNVISLGGFIKETAGFALKGSNVRCEYSISDDLASVEVDEGQIGQVIQNLIINACQAMPEGGVINVDAENIIIDSKKALPLKSGTYVKVSIKDHGVGIPHDLISRIFDPYFTTKQTGSGLGLATTYSIIRNHGGHIVVKSKIGAGTTFYVYLPATDKKADVDMATGKGSFLGQGRILIMDDEESIRNFVCGALRYFGYEVESAINGDEAIKLYKMASESGQPFNAVILDLTVPGGMGGKETVKELLKIDPGANVIVSSGYSNDPIMAEYDKYGFKGVVAKPYMLKELSEVVNKVIKGIPIPLYKAPIPTPNEIFYP